MRHMQPIAFFLAVTGFLASFGGMAGEPGEGQRASRYEDAEYRRSSAVQPLREITNLPNAFVEDLQELIRRSEAAAVIEPDLSTDGMQVKYFGGVGTTNHGLMLAGMPPLLGEPPAGTFANEHCYDAKGHLVKAIIRKEDGTRSVDCVILYEGDRPSCKLYFKAGRFVGGNFGLYRKDKLILVAQIWVNRKVRSCEVIFHSEDREDYTVRYVAKETKEPFALADLRLESIHMKGASRLEFDERGGLKDLWTYYPPKSP